MRGAAPGKKTSGLQQKNVDVFFRRDGAHTVCSLETPAISTRKTKKNKQKTPGTGEGSSTSENPQPPRKKRARVDPTVESEETFMNRVEVKVKIPEELKPWLVDDWDLITRQKQLFYLPAKKNVDSILEDYANYKKSRGNTDNKEYAVNEVVAGIKEYFNVMLGTQLLYKFERPQYAEILADHPDAPMSQVYGAPHLLRLFVRIGAMLAYTPLDEKSLALLLNYLHDFLKMDSSLYRHRKWPPYGGSSLDAEVFRPLERIEPVFNAFQWAFSFRLTRISLNSDLNGTNYPRQARHHCKYNLR
ncbi:mortality factor 4-like protein 1 isoform X4 [Pogona vitticeps]